MNVIIVDDEPQSHQVLNELLTKKHPDVQLIASAYSVQEGFEKVTQLKPELVFLDIELPDGHGFDLLKRIPEPDFLVIFITAHNHYAITAIRFGVLDFLLKPIDPKELSIALNRARQKIMKKATQQQLQILWETMSQLTQRKLPTRMSISTSVGIVFKEIKDIIRLEAQQNYTEFTIENNPKKLLASTNIGDYEEQFELYDHFTRTHRSHLVNLSYVDTFVKSDGGYLVMKNKDQVPVSRKYKDELLDRLNSI
jgi:two-component system LytT family response regulator